MSYIILKAFAIKDKNSKLVSFKKEDIGKLSKAIEKVVPTAINYLLKHSYIGKNDKEKDLVNE